MRFDEFFNICGQLLPGMTVTLEIFFFTLLFALPLGMLIAVGRMSKYKIIQLIFRLYIAIVRGTPLMLQLLVVYFGPYYIFGISISSEYRAYATIIAFSCNYAAYFAEIYRTGINSIDNGQREAAYVLGYNRAQTFFYIILPQVIKRIVPAMGNEVITLVKDTALVSVIGVSELLMVAKERQGALFSFAPLFIAGVFYFFMNWIVSVVFRRLEKKLSYYN